MTEFYEFIQKGGIMMIPLFLCSILAVAIIIEKFISLRQKKVLVPEITAVLKNIKSFNDTDLAIQICRQHKGPFANIILTSLENFFLPHNDLKELINDQGRQEVRALERGLVLLETVAGIAPLLGLLGTVLGMIKVFTVITELGVGQARALSGGIAEALITTVVGLFIGIPALVFYNYFTNRAENLVLDIEKYTSELLNKVNLMKLNQTGSGNHAIQSPTQA